ncbi:MAG TPA: 50S ribosomal protein L11 methyltransferase [Thermoanaerobaculia bacterium]|nr:50S ribosomal protein L11 methyltransferase [Thermoanaerobaculia bacterium]
MLDYHRELLNDELRTHAFREAIAKTVRPGDVVIDLGCGSGILSFFACQAGAARVYAIDSTRMADVAAYLSRHLGFADRITVIQKESREVELPERANVLISETLGVTGFDEGIAGSVKDARARLLTADARIIPCRLGVSLVPVELDYDYDRHVAFWSEPRYGFDLSPLRVFASNAIAFAHIRGNAHLAPPAEMFSLAVGEATEAQGRASFTVQRKGFLHGFGAFFTATLAEGITLTNARARETSWSQALLPLEVPVQVRKGSHIAVELQTDDGRSWRWRGDAAGEPFDQTTWLSMPMAGMG